MDTFLAKKERKNCQVIGVEREREREREREGGGCH